MRKHKSKLLRVAASLSSREAGFVFATIGVFVQAAHTWFITYELSSLSGVLRFTQAGIMAFFISAALLYFTLKSSSADTSDAKKYRKIVWWFACIETFINMYYWGYHLLIEPWPDPQYGKFVIAIPFSILLPFTLKAYSTEVRTEDFAEEDEDVRDEHKELIDDYEKKIEQLNTKHETSIQELKDKLFEMEETESEAILEKSKKIDELQEKIKTLTKSLEDVNVQSTNEYSQYDKQISILKKELEETQNLLSQEQEKNFNSISENAYNVIIEENKKLRKEKEKLVEVLQKIQVNQPKLTSVEHVTEKIETETSNISNGGYKTNPSYVPPKDTKLEQTTSDEDDLFAYEK